jgi:hypothetical protein
MIKLPDPFSEDEIVTSDPAVYLMKVINPPGSQDRQKSTVWLAAKGDVTYIFDSEGYQKLSSASFFADLRLIVSIVLISARRA